VVDKANPVAKQNQSVLAHLDRVRFARRQAAKAVTLWPLVLVGDDEAGELWPLDEALEDGFVGVHRAGGDCVEVVSRAPVSVWIPAGERLGGEGRAAASRVLAPHASATIPVQAGDPPCARCCRALAGAFHAAGSPVGFVAAVHDRAVGLELVLPAGPLARRFSARVEAWAPWLLAAEDSAEAVGFESPEALLAAARAGRPLRGRARVEIASGSDGMALTL
jgi:hypothetical protein